MSQTHVFVAIYFQEVATLGINDESSCPERVVVFPVEDFFGISLDMYEFFFGSIKGQFIESGLFILSESVIHVESNSVNTTQSKFSVTENIIRADRPFRRNFVDMPKIRNIHPNLFQHVYMLVSCTLG